MFDIKEVLVFSSLIIRDRNQKRDSSCYGTHFMSYFGCAMEE